MNTLMHICCAPCANLPIDQLREAGIAYAIDQIVDLIAQGAQGIHLYTMNDPDVARRISQAVENLRKG